MRIDLNQFAGHCLPFSLDSVNALGITNDFLEQCDLRVAR